MKGHHWLYLIGGYFVVAYVYNNYVAQPGGFQLPGDIISNVVG